MVRYGLAWFRHKQRTLTRSVLALFCLAWLQLATMPCVMADVTNPAVESATSAVPAPHDCAFCPPAPPVDHCPPDQDSAVCSYPADPQVDSRIAAAVAIALPALAPVFTLPAMAAPGRSPHFSAAPSHGRPSLPVSYCRYLK